MSDVEIKKICERYNICDYTIKDGLVNVEGNVSLRFNRLIEIPIKFGEVTGNFICSSNKLTSLEGSPTYVGGKFYYQGNQLTDLKDVRIM